MALVPMRLMLDHAAEEGYGIPAFNVNNLEQILAIMQAADETDSPCYFASLTRCAEVRRRKLLTSPGDGSGRNLSSHPCCDAPRPR